MTGVREPAVAGLFYPGDPAVLARTVDDLLSATPRSDGPACVAHIVPHAGYRYSGATAAHVYARLRHHPGPPSRIVLVGPSHRVPLRGAAVSPATAWRTPLGEVPVDAAALRRLTDAGHATADPAPHAAEHAIEVQLPFLQRVFDGDVPPVLPIAVGVSTAESIATLLSRVVEPGDVVVCSTDLSHYLTDVEARRQDARTAEAVLALDAPRIGDRDACGRYALRGLLCWASLLGLRARLLALSTSADSGGGSERVVGYPAFEFGALTEV